MNNIATLFANPIIQKGKLKYLLDLYQKDADGLSKAKYFNAKGFSLPNADQFAAALQKHPVPSRLLKQPKVKWGRRFVFRGDIRTLSGESVCIISVWQIDTGENAARLITAYPAK